MTTIDSAVRSIGDWNNLRRLLTTRRAKLGMTLQAVGDLCGVSRQCVDNWESGKRMPIAANLFMWAAALNVKLESVITL